MTISIVSKDDLTVFIDRDEKQFDIELPIVISPYLIEKDVLKSKEFLLAHFFRYLRSLYVFLKEARKELDLDILSEFPKHCTVDDYLKILKNYYERKEILDKWYNIIRKRYGLLENWEVSIKSVILTHHLPIPYPNNPIVYYIPQTEEEKRLEKEQAKTLSSLTIATDIVRRLEVVKHPAIYFNSKISPNALIEWIENHKNLFQVINKRLPKEISASSKMNIRTQRIGELALIIKWDNITSWSGMQKMIDEWDKKNDYDDYWGEEGRPTAEDLRIAFKSYLAVITKLESGDSESL